MFHDDANPLSGLDLSQKEDQEAWALIRWQIEIVEKMRIFVLVLIAMVASLYLVNNIIGKGVQPDLPFEPVIVGAMTYLRWALLLVGVVGVGVYQLTLHKLRRLAKSLQIPSEKLAYINNLTNWALVHILFGKYGYNLITWCLIKLKIAKR